MHITLNFRLELNKKKRENSKMSGRREDKAPSIRQKKATDYLKKAFGVIQAWGRMPLSVEGAWDRVKSRLVPAVSGGTSQLRNFGTASFEEEYID